MKLKFSAHVIFNESDFPLKKFTSPGDRGDYWSVKSWYVTLDGGVMVSDEIKLNVGDLLFSKISIVL